MKNKNLPSSLSEWLMLASCVIFYGACIYGVINVASVIGVFASIVLGALLLFITAVILHDVFDL